MDRLCAAAFWDSWTDHEQTCLGYAPHRERLDEKRLRERAETEQVVDLLDDFEATASGSA